VRIYTQRMARKGAVTLAVPTRSRVCAPASLEPPRALAFVPREPGCPETTFIYVSRQPGSAGPFAHIEPCPTPDPGNQTCRTCIPRARLGHMHLTKRALVDYLSSVVGLDAWTAMRKM
jgi:hypothetical protein